MFPRPQSAGALGIVAGIALALVLLLYVSTGATHETFADPAKALPFVTQNAGRLRTIAALVIVTVTAATFFVAGLAAKLREKTPTRATGVLYFGILGNAGHGLNALLVWLGNPAVAAYGVKDQVAASHAWVAVNALSHVFGGFGNFFVGLSILLAGWAITSGRVMSSSIGWFSVIAGAVTALAAFAPEQMLLFLGSIVLPIVALLWIGNTLRTMK
jgi:hypothetical protein